MNIRMFKILFILLLVLLVVYLAVGRKDNSGVEPVAVGEVLPSSTLKPATSTPTSTPTVRPTDTSTPTASPSPTPTSTETATLSLRKWTMNEVGTFISFVGSWFTADISYPLLPREGDEVAQLIDEFVYNRATDSLSGPLERVNPDVVCAWAFEKLGEGYGLTIKIDGNVVDEKTREERWIQFASEIGNPDKEPYCPQFDASSEVPVFDDAN